MLASLQTTSTLSQISTAYGLDQQQLFSQLLQDPTTLLQPPFLQTLFTQTDPRLSAAC
ncbi:MAG: hypothetical protein HC924_18690 [Synechococcaceae cyanobacterium SM2_3_2]|nr:hypothetical protein [Synechococcaceae cyanobacterium SM2_3_2]